MHARNHGGCHEPERRLLITGARAATLALAAALAVSCGDGLLAEISRPLGDPRIESPEVSSFVTENCIGLSWSEDPCTDRYVLQRAEDAADPGFDTVYSGETPGYLDADCTDQGRYLYRLVKTRGSRSFGPSRSVMGVASLVCRDSLEPNDVEAAATSLSATLAANLYYYTSIAQPEGAPLVYQDADWYAVSVPPHRQANIVVTQDGLQGGSTDTWMYFYLKGANPQQIVNNQAIPVPNYSDTSTVTLRFKIYPVPSFFAQNGGGSLITYSVSLHSITSW
jgi:hypothetical protein